MGTEKRVEIERCLSQELRMEFDESGHLVLAETAKGILRVDWQSGTARLSNEHGSSVWAAGVSTGDWSAGTWEYSNNASCSLQVYIDDGLRILREGLMGSAKAEVLELCRAWFSYGTAHGLPVDAMDRKLLEFYVATISLEHPEELVALARGIDRDARPQLWAKILERIEAFPTKGKSLIRKELGLAKAPPSGKKAT